MPYVKVGEYKIYYEIDGHGENLLLIHGFSSFLPMWQYLRPLLRKKFRLILPEMRGHGRSDKPNIHYTIDMLSQDLVGILDELKIEKCIVAGHSLGGFVAQQMALDTPERLKALVLICTGPKVGVETVEAWLVESQAGFGLPLKEKVDKQIDVLFYNPQKIRSNPETMKLLWANEKQVVKNQISHGYVASAALRFNVESRLDEIKMPTLIIQGANDSIFPTHIGDYFVAHIPNAVLEVIGQTGHSIQLEQPEALTKAIVKFCQSLL
ncbi:MAG: alpha/beta fold hydrolase [Promethearchaeota archaeon]